MKNERALRRWTVDLLLFAGGLLAIVLASQPSEAALALGVDEIPWCNRLVFFGIGSAFVLFSLLAVRLFERLIRSGRRLRSLRTLSRAEAGTVMVEFALVFPIIYLVMAMIIQLALLANGSLVVRYAAFAAARAAIVRTSAFPVPLEKLPSDQEPAIKKAAHLVLAAISPKKQQQTSTDNGVSTLFTLLKQQKGKWGDKNIKKRMTYASKATQVKIETKMSPVTQWVPFVGALESPVPNPVAPREVQITVTYPFLLTIPGVGVIPGVSKPAPLGVFGRVFNIKQVVKLHGTGPRESALFLADPNSSSGL